MLVKAFRTRNARMGERSSVPPRGGMSPRKMFRYGSHIVLNETNDHFIEHLEILEPIKVVYAIMKYAAPYVVQRVKCPRP